MYSIDCEKTLKDLKENLNKKKSLINENKKTKKK